MDYEKIRKLVREINRPKILSGKPSEEAARQGFVFAQAIRSNAERQGVQHFCLNHFIVEIHGSPRIPRSGTDTMAYVLEESIQYIRDTRATNDAPEATLIFDNNGKITLRKAKEYPYGFNFRFAESAESA